LTSTAVEGQAMNFSATRNGMSWAMLHADVSLSAISLESFN
jgi:hypothetical protein